MYHSQPFLHHQHINALTYPSFAIIRTSSKRATAISSHMTSAPPDDMTILASAASSSNVTSKPLMRVTYRICNEERTCQEWFGEVVQTSERCSINEDSSSSSAQPVAGDFQYSGRHDNGPLPALREGGPMAKLIDCVTNAKKFNDNYLTAMIEQESIVQDGVNSTKEGISLPSPKRKCIESKPSP